MSQLQAVNTSVLIQVFTLSLWQLSFSLKHIETEFCNKVTSAAARVWFVVEVRAGSHQSTVEAPSEAAHRESVMRSTAERFFTST